MDAVDINNNHLNGSVRNWALCTVMIKLRDIAEFMDILPCKKALDIPDQCPMIPRMSVITNETLGTDQTIPDAVLTLSGSRCFSAFTHSIEF